MSGNKMDAHLNQPKWLEAQQRMTIKAVALCYSKDASSLNAVIKRISMKDSLRKGESLMYFS